MCARRVYEIFQISSSNGSFSEATKAMPKKIEGNINKIMIKWSNLK